MTTRTALVFDAETSAMPLWKEPSENPGQPHIVQLCGKIVNLDTRQTIQSMDVIIKPVDWVIEQGTIDLHGITNEYARAVGISEEAAVDMLIEMHKTVTCGRIAYNEPFDMRIIRIAQMRYNWTGRECDEWKNGERECVMRMATPICKIPKLNGKAGINFPKLQEAYKHFFDADMPGAHSAGGDVDATIAVYFAILDQMEEEKALTT